VACFRLSGQTWPAGDSAHLRRTACFFQACVDFIWIQTCVKLVRMQHGPCTHPGAAQHHTRLPAWSIRAPPSTLHLRLHPAAWCMHTPCYRQHSCTCASAWASKVSKHGGPPWFNLAIQNLPRASNPLSDPSRLPCLWCCNDLDRLNKMCGLLRPSSARKIIQAKSVLHTARGDHRTLPEEFGIGGGRSVPSDYWIFRKAITERSHLIWSLGSDYSSDYLSDQIKCERGLRPLDSLRESDRRVPAQFFVLKCWTQSRTVIGLHNCTRKQFLFFGWHTALRCFVICELFALFCNCRIQLGLPSGTPFPWRPEPIPHHVLLQPGPTCILSRDRRLLIALYSV